jgi:hypothetical protein
LNHTATVGALIGQTIITRMVPVFVAGMVLLISVLIIGTFSIAGERLFTLADASGRTNYPSRVSAPPSTLPRAAARTSNLPSVAFARPAPKPVSSLGRAVVSPEPTYQPVSLSASPHDEKQSMRS